MSIKSEQRVGPGTVLITGGAKRIGADIAFHLALQGYRIALHYQHSRTEAQALKDRIHQYKGSCELFSADLKIEKNVLTLIKKVKTRFPDLNVLINNASVFDPSSLHQGDLKNLQKHWEIHLKAPYILTQQFAQLCKAGNIINILDTHVLQNKITHFNYLLSKKSLLSFTQMAATELAPGIRVNAIAPGLILPPATKSNTYIERLAKNIPLQRKGSTANIIQTVQFLIENDYITGQTIFVDGGEHLK